MNKVDHNTGRAETPAQLNDAMRLRNLVELVADIESLRCATRILDDLLNYEFEAANCMDGPFPYTLTGCQGENLKYMTHHVRQQAFQLLRNFDIANGHAPESAGAA